MKTIIDDMSSETATLKDLSTALHDTLHYRGELDSLRAKIRASIHSALSGSDVPPPSMPNENLLANELIMEYLNFNGYGHAASVLRVESGHPAEGTIDRGFVQDELGVEESRGVPLLYGIIEVLKANKAGGGRDLVGVQDRLGDKENEGVGEGRADIVDVDGNMSVFADDGRLAGDSVTLKSTFGDPEPFFIGGD